MFKQYLHRESTLGGRQQAGEGYRTETQLSWILVERRNQHVQVRPMPFTLNDL